MQAYLPVIGIVFLVQTRLVHAYIAKGVIMKSCELAASITALACWLSENKSAEEINFISAVLMQLADTLATISAHEELCGPKDS